MSYYIPATAVSGTATVDCSGFTSRKLQVSCLPISASGTATIRVKPLGGTSFEAIAGTNTIDLSAPVGLIIEGNFIEVESNSDNNGDTYTLVVSPL